MNEKLLWEFRGEGPDVDSAKKCADEVSCAEIAPVALSFFRNVRGTYHLMLLPLVMLYHGFSSTYRVGLTATAMVATGYYRKKDSPEAKMELEKELDRLVEEGKKKAETIKMMDDAVEQQLLFMLQSPEVRSSIRVLCLSATAQAWTSFECLAKDLWVSAVNARPMILGHPTFKAIEDEDVDSGIGRKHVSVALLAKHGFDLRKSLGTALSDRFDFTTLNGIRSAYESTFGRKQLPNGILDNSRLGELEVTRHLIVHRAGVIDESFRRRCPKSAESGTHLEISNNEVCAFIDDTIGAGVALLKWTDQWLQEHAEASP